MRNAEGELKNLDKGLFKTQLKTNRVFIITIAIKQRQITFLHSQTLSFQINITQDFSVCSKFADLM